MPVKIRQAVKIPLQSGPAFFYSFNGLMDGKEHFAVGFEDWEKQRLPLVRIHSECVTGDVFQSLKCDCGDQLEEALNLLQKEAGLLLYLRQEGRGIGLYNKLDAYALQQCGLDTYEANNKLNFPDDLRDYFVAVQMLKSLGVGRLRLLSNNPEKQRQLVQYGIAVEEVCSTGIYLKAENKRYLKAKKIKHQHTLFFENEEADHDTTPIAHQWCGGF